MVQHGQAMEVMCHPSGPGGQSIEPKIFVLLDFGLAWNPSTLPSFLFLSFGMGIAREENNFFFFYLSEFLAETPVIKDINKDNTDRGLLTCIPLDTWQIPRKI